MRGLGIDQSCRYKHFIIHIGDSCYQDIFHTKLLAYTCNMIVRYSPRELIILFGGKCRKEIVGTLYRCEIIAICDPGNKLRSDNLSDPRLGISGYIYAHSGFL